MDSFYSISMPYNVIYRKDACGGIVMERLTFQIDLFLWFDLSYFLKLRVRLFPSIMITIFHHWYFVGEIYSCNIENGSV